MGYGTGRISKVCMLSLQGTTTTSDTCTIRQQCLPKLLKLSKVLLEEWTDLEQEAHQVLMQMWGLA